MKRLIIADVKSFNNGGKSTGHYFSIAQNYLDLYGEVVETKVAGGQIYQSGFDKSVLFQLPYNSDSWSSSIKNKLHTLLNCRYLFKKTGTDDVIVMQHSGASTTFLGIALYAKKRNNIYVIQYDTDAISSFVKRWIFSLAKKRIKGFICPSERIAESYGVKGCVVTDYIYQEKGQIVRLPYKDRKYDFVLVGNIAKDKGVVEAATLFAGTRYRVLIAGKGEESYMQILENVCKAAGNIELHLGYVDAVDYYRYIKEARYCMLNYSGVYSDRSSGVVLDVLFNGTPIVGHRCKALSFVERENVGILFDDISNFDPEGVLNENDYYKYQDGIDKFLAKQKYLRDKVIDFLNLKLQYK